VHIRDWIPPALLSCRRRLFRPGVCDPVSDPAFDTYEEALRHFPRNAYESDFLVDIVYRKTQSWIQGLAATQPSVNQFGTVLGVIAAASLTGGVVNVLDVGGACGTHYHYTKTLLSGYALRWCVLETKPMADRAAEMNSAELRFVSSLQEGLDWLGSLDLVHSCYALTYFPNPAQNLAEFVSLQAPVMLWGRLPLTETPPFTVVQSSWLSANGPGRLPEGIKDRIVTYPEHFLDRPSFERIVLDKYRIMAAYADSSGDAHTSRGHVKGRTYLLVGKQISRHASEAA